MSQKAGEQGVVTVEGLKKLWERLVDRQTEGRDRTDEAEDPDDTPEAK